MQHCEYLNLNAALTLSDSQQQPDGQTTTPDTVPRAGFEHAGEEGRTHHATGCCSTSHVRLIF
jgi:hypothetical protein